MNEPQTLDEAVAYARDALKGIRAAMSDAADDDLILEDLKRRESLILDGLREHHVYGDF